MGGSVDVPVGVHACCWFDQPDQRRSVVRQFVTTGLERGERVAIYANAGSPPLLDLADRELADRIDGGQLVIAVAEDAYFPDGSFDGEQRAADFAQFAADTAAAGYPALRVYADNGRMPRRLPTPDAWLEYELRVARTVPRFPLIGLCGFSAYDRPALSAELLDAVHHQNVTGGVRSSEFHFHGNADGSLSLTGVIEAVSLDRFGRLVAAGRPVLEQSVVSLRDVTFADAAGAAELHRLMQIDGLTLVEVPAGVRRVWDLLGLALV